MSQPQEKLDDICRLISEDHLSVEHACARKDVDPTEFTDYVDNDPKAKKQVRKSQAKAVQFWEKRMQAAEKSGESKAAQIQLRALDERYRKKKQEDETFNVTVQTVSPDHLPKMPVQHSFGDDSDE